MENRDTCERKEVESHILKRRYKVSIGVKKAQNEERRGKRGKERENRTENKKECVLLLAIQQINFPPTLSFVLFLFMKFSFCSYKKLLFMIFIGSNINLFFITFEF